MRCMIVDENIIFQMGVRSGSGMLKLDAFILWDI